MRIRRALLSVEVIAFVPEHDQPQIGNRREHG
jgi:hypothetical protein